MTRCTLYVDAEGRITGFCLKGHSGYAAEGEDIVCAGLSTIALTIENALCQLLRLDLDEKGGENGYMEVHLPKGLTDAQMHDAQLLLSTLHLGLQNIATEYPGFVRLTTQRVR